MDKLAEVLTPVHAAYIRKFESVLASLHGTVRRFVVEPEMRGPDGELTRRGMFGAGARLDIMTVTHYGSVKALPVDSDLVVDFPTVRFVGNDLEVGLSPFRWESAEIWVEGPASEVSSMLGEWFRSAFKPDENRGHEALQGVAHFISDPVVEGDLTTCVMDLGTASVARVASLLDYLRRAGVRRVDLGRLQT